MNQCESRSAQLLSVRSRGFCRYHVTGVCLLSQSVPEKHSQEKKPTNLCASREFLQLCLPCLLIIQSCYSDYRINNHMFSLRDLRFVLFSRDLDVLRAQRIIGFFMLITHNSTRSKNAITWLLCIFHV